MQEIAVISGKGGTGKTSIAASLAALAQPVVLVDCDVDAADLHLVLQPDVMRRKPFFGGSKARIHSGLCRACGRCAELCQFEAISRDGPGNGQVARTFRVEQLACEGCGVCFDYCPAGAIEFKPQVCGQWYVSDTRCGPMVHARLEAAAENSGKLVTQLRRTGQQIALTHGLDLAIIDGSPGIGCPVIASLTGASLALIVAEPTASSLHDFDRIAQLASQLDVPAMLVVNKADLNPQVADRVRASAVERGIEPIGKVPYDRAVTLAQLAAQTVVESSTGPAAQAIRRIWQRVECRLRPPRSPAASALVQLAAGVSQPHMQHLAKKPNR